MPIPGILFATRALALFAVLTPASMLAQEQPPPPEIPSLATTNAAQTAEALGLTSMLTRLQSLQAGHRCGAPTSVEELALRQELLESVTASSLDVDGVLAEIANERTDLAELRSTLEGRRDHTVGLLNVANLITGTGLGIAVNAMQFSTATANLGDGIGVGSGIASTVLSVIGIRRQNGPQHGVGEVPNMLGPLFDVKPALNTYYPPEVLRYLQSVPATESPERGTRLQQLMAEWQRDGRVDPPGSAKRDKKIVSLTASSGKNVKLTIGDLVDRSAMLGDVSGRVALMKRDMAAIMRSYRGSPETCRH